MTAKPGSQKSEREETKGLWNSTENSSWKVKQCSTNKDKKQKKCWMNKNYCTEQTMNSVPGNSDESPRLMQVQGIKQIIRCKNHKGHCRVFNSTFSLKKPIKRTKDKIKITQNKSTKNCFQISFLTDTINFE